MCVFQGRTTLSGVLEKLRVDVNHTVFGVNLTCIHLNMLHVQEYIIFSVNETSTEASLYAYICCISLIMHIRGYRGYTQSATEFEGVDWWF